MGRRERCKGLKWREESKKGKMDSSLDGGDDSTGLGSMEGQQCV